MQAKALPRAPVKAVILLAALSALAIFSAPCGAGAKTALVTLTPASYNFGNVPIHTASNPETFTLKNNLWTPLSITSITLNNTDFAESSTTCGSRLAGGKSCTISVTLTPSVLGTETATLTVNDSAPPPYNVLTSSLSGTGAAPVVSLSPTSLAFGNEPIDVTSAAQTVTLSNTGNAALSITSLALTGPNGCDFAQNNTCGSSLAAGANCTIAVMFTPSVAASETASLSISDNASGSPQAVSLSGTGIHDIILSWTASGSSGVVGYNVYRGTTSGGESSTPLNSTPVNGISYTDANVTAGTTYYYVVEAVGSNGTQSPASNETEATVP